MGCSSCGQISSRCTCASGCASQAISGTGGCCTQPCGGAMRGNPNCCCGPSLPSAPIPFYACVSACPESHMQRITIQQFYADVAVENTWNIPGCGETATLTVPGLRSINVGSYIWNEEFGFFEITAFDVTKNQITVLNHCNDGNAASGTNVPACTLFTITVPPCDCGDTNQVCVAIDFTAPEVGDCLDITLTSTQGLTSSDTIQIGSGFYFLEAIKPNNIVTICNQGEGIVPGTPVIAKDANGNFQYCIAIISTNPCDRTPESEVRLLGCGDYGVSVPLGGGNTGWVATLFDQGTGGAIYAPLGNNSETCTQLAAPLHIVSGTASYANVAVADTTNYSIDDVLEVQGYTGGFATITGIPDANHLDITFAPVPSVTITISTGNFVCLQSCCQTVQHNLDALPFYGNSESFLDEGPFTPVTELHPDQDGANHNFTITNPSSTKSMYVMLTMRALITGKAIADLDPPAAWSYEGKLVYSINGGPIVEEGYGYTGFGSVAGQSLDPQEMDFQVIVPQFQIIPPGATYSFDIRGRVTFINPGLGNTASYNITIMRLGYSAIGVPVP